MSKLLFRKGSVVIINMLSVEYELLLISRKLAYKYKVIILKCDKKESHKDNVGDIGFLEVARIERNLVSVRKATKLEKSLYV